MFIRLPIIHKPTLPRSDLFHNINDSRTRRASADPRDSRVTAKGADSGSAQLRLAKAAVLTAGDVLARADGNSTGRGVALRGGTWRLTIRWPEGADTANAQIRGTFGHTKVLAQSPAP